MLPRAYVVSESWRRAGQPELFAAAIVKETAQFYFLDFDGAPEGTFSAFSYTKRQPKGRVSLTAMDAWERFVSDAAHAKESAERDFSDACERLAIAKRELEKARGK